MKNLNMNCKRVYSFNLPSEALSELHIISSHFDLRPSTVISMLICDCYDRLLSDPIFVSGRKFLSDSEYYVAVERVIRGNDR